MAIAGKVAITPKGNWSASTAYTKLDLVFYDNASYVAIQPSTGVTPTNTAYWMLVVQSAGGADLEAIINGTTQVGNALTLDGHGAEYFAKETDLLNYIAKADKPTGTYTGNGNATLRQINVGGIGKALLVWGGGYGAIVYPDGAIISDGTTITSLPVTQCSFSDGNYVLATAHLALNTSGGERGYIVL